MNVSAAIFFLYYAAFVGFLFADRTYVAEGVPTSKRSMIKSADRLSESGFDCKNYGFNPETCSCRNACAIDVVCEHGAMPSGVGSDCKCDCAKVNGPQDVLSVNSSFWEGATCGACAKDAGEKCVAVSLALDNESCACVAPTRTPPTQELGSSSVPSDTRNETCILKAGNCQNDGVLSKRACECKCASGWYGRTCAVSEDEKEHLGDSKETAAGSCYEILSQNPDADSDDLYWIQSASEQSGALQLHCDMAENGGGWALIADVGLDMVTQLLTNETYEKGYPENWRSQNEEGDNFIVPCRELDFGTDAVEIRVSMGSVRDFFRPLPGESLCSMLMHHDRHVWSPSDGTSEAVNAFHDFACENGDDSCTIHPFDVNLFEATVDPTEGSEQIAALLELVAMRASRSLRHRRRLFSNDEESEDGKDEDGETSDRADGQSSKKYRWWKPEFVTDPKLAGLLGGAKKGWGVDGREYISFWGGDKGGCCHSVSSLYPNESGVSDDEGAWGQTFKIHMRPALIS
eukprot:g3499.t1